ncbi:MAG: SUMF1/EgtB/PvdO family nonheme iron enzyme [Candidatus Omnitrophota bacterium]
MPRILIEEKKTSDLEKILETREKTNTITQVMVIIILAILIIGLIAGIVYLGLNISRKTKAERKGSPADVGELPGETPETSARYSRPAGSGSPAPGPVNTGAPGTVPPGNMVLIPAGEYIRGWSENGQPIKGSLPAFYVDQYEVTNREYFLFVRATGHRAPTDPRGAEYNIWRNNTYPPELADHPVVNVSYQDAETYAAWKGGRLPTEDEWGKAARGTEGFTYPWGNQFKPILANVLANCAETSSGSGGTMPAGSFPSGRSPYGIFDPAGNVKEWTATPYESGNSRWKVSKGGSFQDSLENVSTFARSKGVLPAPDLGFRCVRDVK